MVSLTDNWLDKVYSFRMSSKNHGQWNKRVLETIKESLVIKFRITYLNKKWDKELAKLKIGEMPLFFKAD